MLASSLRACFHFHFNHYLVLSASSPTSIYTAMMMMEISDQTEQRAGRGNGWTNGQRSQQSTNKGQRSTTTSIKQTTNTNTKRMQSQGKGKGSAEEARIYYIYMAVSQNSVGIDHGVMVTHTGSPQPQTQKNTLIHDSC